MPLFRVNSLKYDVAESNFIHFLGHAGSCITQGITTPDIRRERLRAYIEANGLADEIMWCEVTDTVTWYETYRRAWERLYALPFYGHNVAATLPEPSNETETSGRIDASPRRGYG